MNSIWIGRCAQIGEPGDIPDRAGPAKFTQPKWFQTFSELYDWFEDECCHAAHTTMTFGQFSESGIKGWLFMLEEGHKGDGLALLTPLADEAAYTKKSLSDFYDTMLASEYQFGE